MSEKNETPETSDESSIDDVAESSVVTRADPFSTRNSAEFSYETAVRSRQSQENASLGLSAHWSVPWSDLMMVMFVLFAVLFAMQLAERDINEMFTESGPSSDSDVQVDADPPLLTPKEILRQSELLVANADLENIDVVLTENQAIKISVRGPLLFDLGKADLRQPAMSFLDQLALVIAGNNYLVQVLGHTDTFPISTPTFPTNWELSAARAARVARYLISSANLQPGRFSVIGHSFYRPAFPNDSIANKAANRRVEIIITRQEYQS